MPKIFLAVGAVTLALTTGSAVAKDTEAEAQLREALRQKMNELGSSSVAPAAPVTPTVEPARAKPAAQPAVTPAPTPSTPPAVKPTAAPAAAPAGAVPPTTSPLIIPVAQDDSEMVKMREALRQRLEQEAATPTPVVEVTPAPTLPETKVPTATKPTTAGYVPMVAPALPLTGTKEQRLQQLLQQYKADQITPAEYHAQRAKIIAE